MSAVDYLLSFSKLPPYNMVDNILSNRHIKNITSENHEAIILTMKTCHPSN